MKDHESTGQIAPARFCQNPSPPPYQAGWFLVDQAKCPDALKTLFETEQRPQYDLPYLYSGFNEQAYHGPLLIEPVEEACRDWLERWLADGKALALYGQNLSIETVRDHWVSLNWINTPTGEGFFRYADPASFAGVGLSLSLHQCQRLLGHSQRYRVVMPASIGRWSTTIATIPSHQWARILAPFSSHRIMSQP